MDGLISYFPESDVAVVRQLAGGGVAATLTSSPRPVSLWAAVLSLL